MNSRNDRYLYWLLGVGCGVLVTGAFMTYIGLSVQDELRILQTSSHSASSYQQQMIEESTDNIPMIEPKNVEAVDEQPKQDTNGDLIEELLFDNQADSMSNESTEAELVPVQIDLTIPTDATATIICDLLEESGVIDSSEEFKAYLVQEDKTKKLQTGDMRFIADAPFEEILDTLLSKKR